MHQQQISWHHCPSSKFNKNYISLDLTSRRTKNHYSTTSTLTIWIWIRLYFCSWFVVHGRWWWSITESTRLRAAAATSSVPSLLVFLFLRQKTKLGLFEQLVLYTTVASNRVCVLAPFIATSHNCIKSTYDMRFERFSYLREIFCRYFTITFFRISLLSRTN